MTRKEQNKILDNKIESNVNQHKVDRLNAEISAFSRGDLNKYEFLTRKDLKYKPNALDKARFEFSPLGEAFSTGLDKTAQGYQEEGVIILLKDIRDGLARTPGVLPRIPGVLPRVPPRGPSDRPNDDDDSDDDDSDNDNNMPNLETKEEAARTNVLNKFNDKIDNFDEMFKDKGNEFNEMFEDKENKLSSKLNKSKNNIKKLNSYIKESNDKKIDIEKKLAVVENDRNNLLLKYNQLNEELNKTKNELYETKKGLDEAADDINEKIKYTDKLKEIQEKLDYQNAKETKLKYELNEKNEIIEDLKSKNTKIINDNNDIYKKYYKINKDLGEEIRKLKENMSKTKEYFDYYEKNRTKMQEKIDEINKLNDELNKENQETKKELDEYKKN